ASISIPLSSTRYVSNSDLIEVRDQDGDPIDYVESDLTRGMRERLNRWNDFAEANHWIDLLVPDTTLERPLQGDRVERVEDDPFGERARDRPLYVDFRKIRLHRVFNNTLDEGGRFYGGWWQNIPSKYRRFITINGVPTRELDYSNLHAAMLYAREGLPWIG